MHPQKLDSGQEAELVHLLGDLEVTFEVVLSERVEDMAIYQVGGESLCKMSQSAVMGPLVRNPTVIYVPSVGVLASVGSRRDEEQERAEEDKQVEERDAWIENEVKVKNRKYETGRESRME